MKPTLHVIALPHTTLTEKDITCAYSMKVPKFTGMMLDQGYEVILYGPDQSDARCTEHVVITTEEDRVRWGFSADGFDTVLTPFLWTTDQPYWYESNQRAEAAMRERVRPRDLLCLIAGWCQKPLADAFPAVTAVEWGVGYEGIFSPFCAFESYAWMHHVYGMRQIINGRAFDQVIPNFFDVNDFTDPAVYLGAPKADYLLYIGRIVERKGPHIAALIAKRMGLPLVVAGPGATSWERGKIVAPEVTLEGDVEYVGQVGFAERARLMSRACAVLVPTIYVEPFGGVAVEAMMSGTPVVASDWGSFTEIVTPDVGARFRTIQQGVEAVERVKLLNSVSIRAAAVERYGLAAVGQQFDAWFKQLDTLWGKGYYA